MLNPHTLLTENKLAITEEQLVFLMSFLKNIMIIASKSYTHI